MAVCLEVPLIAVTVRVDEPRLELFLVVTVSVEVNPGALIVPGLNDPLAPEGSPLRLSCTLPAKPFSQVIVTV